MGSGASATRRHTQDWSEYLSSKDLPSLLLYFLQTGECTPDLNAEVKAKLLGQGPRQAGTRGYQKPNALLLLPAPAAPGPGTSLTARKPPHPVPRTLAKPGKQPNRSQWEEMVSSPSPTHSPLLIHLHPAQQQGAPQSQSPGPGLPIVPVQHTPSPTPQKILCRGRELKLSSGS